MRLSLIFSSIVFLCACSSDDEPIDCEKSGPLINIDNVIDATSCSTNDGGIEVVASGGKEPYTFIINDQPVEGGGNIGNLSAGIYSVTVKDANHCTATINNVTILAADFSFSTTRQSNTLCVGGNGSVTIDVASSNPPYSFRLGNGNFTDENIFTGLATGEHKIAVKDNSNCMVTLTINILQGPTGTSWSNEILPIMEKNCAMTGCHNGVSRANNFKEYASVKSFATSIKTKTQDRSMPFDGSLTQNQIDLIACWVDDGALQN